MPRIIVKNAQVHEEKSQKSGNIMRSQMAEMDLGNGYALPFRVGLGQRTPYAPGEYDVDPASFALGSYGDLTLRRYVDLVPVGARPAAK